MYKCETTGKLKCGCNHTEFDHKSEWEVRRHLDTPLHTKWMQNNEAKAQQQSLLSAYNSAKKADADKRLELVGTRMSSLSKESKEFCEDMP